ncbi:unnamed protein product [Acanthosepion pharaonis]|uniref:Cadherin domain-containing protein n=1 Tax=Acanthosepion pharaonis TaxID=158019 RepID=A0A812AS99_ACAPH|nr:unnamed protein product [Sepia pharaonis]
MNNKAPTVNGRFTFSILEGQPKGTLVGCIHVSDPDGDDLIYSTNSTDFSVNSTTGELKSQTVFDFEKNNQYNILVEVTDKIHKANIMVTINVIDVNDHNPQFSQNEYKVNLTDFKNGATVTQVSANDDDPQDHIVYSLKGDSHFKIHPKGTIVLTRNLDWKTKEDSITLMATATDLKNSSTSVLVSLSLIKPLEFARSNFTTSISEAAPTGTIVFKGIVRTRMPLIWHHQNNKIPITVVVHDSDNKSNQTEEHITVEVIDVNDHVPEFSQKSYKFQIAENVAKTFNIQATDMDGGKNAHVTYSFFPSQPQVVKGSILLNATTGTLSISSLDREDKVEYTFDIMAKDGGNPPMNSTTKVTVEVLDVNDNAPVFTKAEYNANVNENSEPQKILTVHADDKDAGLNGLVFYKLQNKSVPFIINQITGDIWSMMVLDFEKNPMYKFQILATDQSSNPKTSSCSVTINVLDICDEVPQLTTVISLSKDKIVGTSVFSLKSSENGTNYNISAEHDIVDINKKTGNVFTSSKIPNTATNYHMTVTAWSQCHLPVLTEFEIKPEDPILKTDEKELKAELTENHCSNQSMFNLSGLPEFQGKDVSFNLRTFNEFFKIENGQIYCQVAVDREKYSQFELLIEVSYKYKPIAYTADETLKVVVTVSDVNDNQPQFQTPSLFYSIPSTAQFFYQVGKIKVIDKDDGENGASRFSLSKDDKDLFYINPSSDLHI